MNLHGIVAGAIGAVNPLVPITIQVSTGFGVAPGGDGTQAPMYAAPVTVFGQVQALSYGDIVHADAMQIQGVRRKLYINGEVDGLIREENKGGDLIQLPNGTIWLVAEVLEYWPDWTSAIITLQNDKALPAVTPIPAGSLAVTTNPGLGFIVYSEAATQTTLSLDPGVRTQLTMTVDPAKTVMGLRAPFDNFVMWDGSLIKSPNINDVLALRIAMNATASVAGGNLKIEAQLAGTTTILDTKNELLSDQASTTERVFFDLLVYAGPTFVTAGVQLYLTSSVPATILNEAVLIAPQSAGP